MKTLIKFGILFFAVAIVDYTHAQKHQSSFQLEDNITITATTEIFHWKEHELDTCRTTEGKKICLIDNKIFFGTDGLELPKYELKELLIVLDGVTIPLETSGMYNPNVHHADLRKLQFKIVKSDPGYLLTGFFSDGIGTYIAQWLILKKNAIRIKISNKENDIDGE